MNSHSQREQLTDLLCDALGPTERARVESHLAQCAQCARELRALERMQQTMASLPAATPPARLRENVRATLLEEKKQLWALSALRPRRAKTSADATRQRPVKDSERIGARKALPFALPARSLAWGGAAAVAAVGLMLLARPSFQNDSTFRSAPTSESELATSADSNVNAGAATDGAADSADAPNTATDLTGNSAVAKPSQTPTTNATNKAPADAQTKTAGAPQPAIDSAAPGSAGALPPRPPSPRPRVAQTENLAPLPQPSFDFFPPLPPAPSAPPRNTKRNNGKKLQPTAPAQTAPQAPARPAPAQVAPPKTAPQQAPATRNPPSEAKTRSLPAAPPAALPAAGLSADSGAQENADGSRENNFAPAPMNEVPGVSAPRSPVARADEARVARKSGGTKKTTGWTGGEVIADLKRGDTPAPVLTLSVTKAIGNARLLLLLPDGETQVWRGSMNALPIQIKLPELAGRVRSGQKVRARLEQTSGEGNPTASTTFDVFWP